MIIIYSCVSEFGSEAVVLALADPLSFVSPCCTVVIVCKLFAIVSVISKVCGRLLLLYSQGCYRVMAGDSRVVPSKKHMGGPEEHT